MPVESVPAAVTAKARRSEPPRVGIIIVNWNGWRDTVECIESLLLLEHKQVDVIVVDNGSTDASVIELKRHIGRCATEPAASLVHDETIRECITWHGPDEGFRIILISVGANLGFAGASNVGAKFAVEGMKSEYCWFLNNDTQVDQFSLSELIHTIDAQPTCGVCGSRIHEMKDRDRIQAQGGCAFDWWRARGESLGRGLTSNERLSVEEVERRIAYVSGASMFVRADFIRSIGPMSEDYFLYFEEMDWAVRGRKAGFRCCYADGSIVFHKEGASIGSGSSKQAASPRSLYYLTRARLRFATKHVPWTLPTVCVTVVRALIGYLVRGERDRANAVWRGAVDYARGFKGSI